jgi:hypothetical protein
MIVDDDGALKPSASTAAAAAAPAVAAAGPEGAEGDEASPPKRRGRGGARVKGVRMPKEPKAPRVMMMDAAGAGAAAAGGEDEEGYTIDALGRRRGGNMHRDPSTGHFLRKPQPGLDPEAHITDAHLFDTLPVAAQRCYLILRDLMSHPLAPPFNFPVDRADYPSYYRIVAQAVAFSDIRHHLVTGGYHHALTHFYSDVILVLENAVAYNPENHALNAAAQKLAVVFERMFLETVLSYDHPLPFTDSCHFCRGHEPCVVDKKHIQCERCEAFHHIKCLAAREKLYARQVLAHEPCYYDNYGKLTIFLCHFSVDPGVVLPQLRRAKRRGVRAPQQHRRGDAPGPRPPARRRRGHRAALPDAALRRGVRHRRGGRRDDLAVVLLRVNRFCSCCRHCVIESPAGAVVRPQGAPLSNPYLIPI